MIRGYTDLQLETPGCHPGSREFRAMFKFNADISSLFPYLNAIATKPSYFDKPHYIKFAFHEYACALYPDKGVLALVESKAQAITAIEALIEFCNDVYSKMDSIEPNHTVFKPVPPLSIYKLLPKTNCQACGYPTCMAFAASLGNREATLDTCPECSHPDDEHVMKLRGMLGE